jgi:hypothetical protein
MDGMTVKYHKIYDCQFGNWDAEVADKWVYADFALDPRYKKKWISITSLAAHQKSGSVFLGAGSFSSELLWRFDRRSETISSCGYEAVGEPFDAKFHRSLELDGDTLYGGVALLHDIDRQFEAKGGRLMSYDVSSGRFAFLGRPAPPAYIQSIALDRERRAIYGFGALPEVFFSFDLKTNRPKFIAHIGNGCELAQSHNPVIDGKGRVWGTYGILRAFAYRTGDDSIRLFRYDPETEKMNFFGHGMPRAGAGDKGRPDAMLAGPDGMIYVGTDAGALARLDPETAETAMLCRPNAESGRLAGLAFRPSDGLLYGICGDNYDTRLFAYDTGAERLAFIRKIKAEDGVSPVRIHHMVFADDKTIFAGENDNHERSSYLWEIVLEGAK